MCLSHLMPKLVELRCNMPKNRRLTNLPFQHDERKCRHMGYLTPPPYKQTLTSLSVSYLQIICSSNHWPMICYMLSLFKNLMYLLFCSHTIQLSGRSPCANVAEKIWHSGPEMVEMQLLKPPHYCSDSPQKADNRQTTSETPELKNCRCHPMAQSQQKNVKGWVNRKRKQTAVYKHFHFILDVSYAATYIIRSDG